MTTLDQIVAKQQTMVAAQALSLAERTELEALRREVEELRSGGLRLVEVNELDEFRGRVRELEAEKEALKNSFAELSADNSAPDLEDVLYSLAMTAGQPPDPDAKTIGLKLNPEVRAQLDLLKDSREDLNTLKQCVLTCILFGLNQLKQLEK